MFNFVLGFVTAYCFIPIFDSLFSIFKAFVAYRAAQYVIETSDTEEESQSQSQRTTIVGFTGGEKNEV